MFSVEMDITKTLDQFNKLSNDMPFLISKSMNDVAFLDARTNLSKDMTKSLVIRNKGIASKTMFQVIRSHKTNLEVSIFHRIPEIGLQQSGGTESPKGKKLAIPHRKNMARYAGVSSNKPVPKRLRVDTLMKKAPSSRSDAVYNTSGVKPFILKTGIYIRQGTLVRALYYFVDKAKHTKKDFDFQQSVTTTFNKRFTKRFNVNYIKQLRK